MSGIKVTATHSGSRPGDRAFDPLHKRDRKLMAVVGVAYGIIGAIGEAVETDHATRRVDHMARQVNARSLAAMLTAPTLDATVGVNVDAEDGITGDETEGRANRTYGVAERAPVAEGDCPDYHHCQNRNKHSGQGGYTETQLRCGSPQIQY